MSSSESDSEIQVGKNSRTRAQPVKRKARAKKDPTMPKRGLSSYFCFMRDERPALVAARPGLKIGEVAKVLAAKWNKLGANERQKFQILSDEDKERYNRELKVWQAKQNGTAVKATAPSKKQKKQPVVEEEVEEEEEEGEEEEEEDEDSD